MFVLEVVEFNSSGKFVHVGYMNAKFKSKKDAVSYYDRHNSHMRSLNAHNTFASDWDPLTRRKYIVRKDHQLAQTVDTFDPADMPTLTESGGVFKYLK